MGRGALRRYKDSKSYPREPRGYLELKGCFLVKGQYLRYVLVNDILGSHYSRCYTPKLIVNAAVYLCPSGSF